METEIDGSFSLSTDRCLRGAGTYVADMDVPDAAHSTARASSGQPGTSSLRSTYLVPDGD
ncbi:MAG: hypothetical protein JOY83_10990 [Alphaproteobacteria bacterium]|nr:hypothetical protein [Alphaproteobacteria bacterium]